MKARESGDGGEGRGTRADADPSLRAEGRLQL